MHGTEASERSTSLAASSARCSSSENGLFAWNVATFSRAWLYPSQIDGWALVSPSKLGAWYLLMYISFILVAVVHKPQGKA